MNWAQARQLLLKRRPVPKRAAASTPRPTAAADPARVARKRAESLPVDVDRAVSICVASGKGGTGKSTLTASLSTLLAERGDTLLFDADLGVANAHILQDVQPRHSIVDAVEGRRSFEDVLHSCGEGLDLLPGGSGFVRATNLSRAEMLLLASGLERLERDYDHLIVDSAAGLSEQTLTFAAVADIVIVVTTPDVTALTDAYAFLKALVQRAPRRDPLLVINRVGDDGDAEVAARRLIRASKKFLGREPRLFASLPEDRASFRCTQRRQPVVLGEPDSLLAGGLRALGLSLLAELDEVRPAGLGRELLLRTGD